MEPLPFLLNFFTQKKFLHIFCKIVPSINEFRVRNKIYYLPLKIRRDWDISHMLQPRP